MALFVICATASVPRCTNGQPWPPKTMALRIGQLQPLGIPFPYKQPQAMETAQKRAQSCTECDNGSTKGSRRGKAATAFRDSACRARPCRTVLFYCPTAELTCVHTLAYTQRLTHVGPLCGSAAPATQIAKKTPCLLCRGACTQFGPRCCGDTGHETNPDNPGSGR